MKSVFFSDIHWKTYAGLFKTRHAAINVLAVGKFTVMRWQQGKLLTNTESVRRYIVPSGNEENLLNGSQ